MRGAITVATWCAVAATAGANEPERQSVTLEYQVATSARGCPSALEFRGLVAARLGYDPFHEDGPMHAQASIEMPGDSLKGSVALLDGANATVGSRNLTASAGGCSSLSEAMALALAIAIDPQVLTRGPISSQSRNVEASRSDDSPHILSPQPETALPAVAASSSPAWTISVAGLGSFGLLPTFAPGLSVNAAMQIQSFSLHAGAVLYPSSSLDALGGEIDSSLILGELAGCAHWSFAGLCVRANSGLLRTSGRGFANDREGSLPMLTLGPQFRAEWRPVAKLVLSAEVAADLALIRNSISVGATQAWQSPLLAIDGGISVGWGFP